MSFGILRDGRQQPEGAVGLAHRRRRPERTERDKADVRAESDTFRPSTTRRRPA